MAIDKLEAGEINTATRMFQYVLKTQPGHHEALRGLAHCRVESCMVADAVELFKEAGSYSEALFYSLHLPGNRDSAHEWWGNHFQMTPQPPAWNHTRLRVGYVSPFFRTHTVTKFFLAVIENHTKYVETYCYSDCVHDAVTERVKKSSTHWRDTGTADNEALAEIIRADEIDILVDLTGHLGRGVRCPLWCLHPARVMIGYIGYPSWNGLPDVWRIGDKITDPKETNEKVVTMPGCAWAYEPDDSPEPVERTGSQVVYGSFNRGCKVTEETAKTWGKIIASNSNSKLLFLAVGGEANIATRSFLVRCGVPAGQLELVGKMPRKEYLRRMAELDLVLDPWPYNGMTTTCDCLVVAGVPVVTLAGEHHRGRVGASLLGACGLHDLVANSVDEYIAIAGDVDRLRRLRIGLKERARAALCDGKKVAKDLEGVYRSLHEK
jgi:protein O-GlcNAc transferase